MRIGVLLVLLFTSLSSFAVQNESSDRAFDSNICTSEPMTTHDARKYFKPGQTSALIGDFHLYARFRQCTVLTGCTEWTETKNIAATLKDKTVRNMKLILQVINKEPYFSSVFGLWSEHGLLPQFPMDPRNFLYNSVDENVHFSVKGSKIGINAGAYYMGGFNFGKDCLWARWSGSNTIEGVTNTVEVVLHGVY